MTGGMSGYDAMYPMNWFATAGDATGDLSHNHAYSPDGNFFNDLSQPSGAANPSGAASLYPSAAVAALPVGAYAGYVNSALMNPGSQAPLPGGPALMMGPQQGPWSYSDYAAGIPSVYISAAPPWKSAPMQAAANALPPAGQAAVHAGGTNPPVAVAPAAGGCAGCAGGCGGGHGGLGPGPQPCRGTTHQALSLDSTNDFAPLYSHYQANPTQVVNAGLYQAVSTHVPSWTTAQGAPGDLEQPLQGQ
ncbi:MAG TPA: hypothetical protein VIX37_14840 [Candidatus Sulfotelmatobacter sp.]